ncbi:MAG: cell envelope integrity protein CreD [Steroidobacter sp.]
MSRSLIFKLGAIGLLVLLLLIPLMQINGLVTERQQRRDEVVQDIARSSSYSQTLTGPLLIVPYRKTERSWREDTTTHQRVTEEHEVTGELFFLPETFNLEGNVKTEERSRGIYIARLYHSDNQISGKFRIPEKLGIGEDYAAYRFGTAYIAMGISDIRGIEDSLTLDMDDKNLSFEPGAVAKILGSGVHAPVQSFDVLNSRTYSYRMQLKLQGTNDLQITPVGRTSKVTLDSNWPNPSFAGEYLPSERNVDSKGFHAVWNSTFFSTNMVEALNNCTGTGNCGDFNNRHLGVSLIDPVDQYLKTDRATKYALLFIALTFAGFFLFEVIKQLAVHPIQYGLVGLALAMFYLLLLSLSEHISFGWSYAISATACAGLISFYVSHVLHSAARGLGFGISLAGLYVLLYGLLSAEDYSLLMGSILVFGSLSVVMILTRNINWFGITNRQTA